jgi:hypothetical protein
MLQRKCACGGAPGVSGECTECRDNSLQRKALFGTHSNLAISQPGDAMEREADRVADAVMSAASTGASSSEPTMQRQTPRKPGRLPADAKYPPKLAKGDETLSRKESGCGSSPTGIPPLVHDVVNSPGEPLDAMTQNFFEARFGHDFSRVRVHSSAAAEQSAREINARAYTVGHDIVFSAGRFAPGTQEGRRLIAHELTHVAQQEGASVDTLRRKEGDDPGTDAPKSPPPSAPPVAATSACGRASLAATIGPSDKRLNGTPVEATLGATDFGNTSKLGADFKFAACKVGTNWRFQLDALVVPIASKVQAITHRINIPTAADSNVTKTSYPKIVSDLSPTTTGTFSVSCGGKSFKDKVTTYSPRAEYWNQQFVIDHEAFHRKDWTDKYRTELVKAESDIWAHTIPATDAKDAAAAVAKADPDLTKYMTDAYQRLCDVFTPAKESHAYDAGAPAYQQLVDQINERAKKEKWV